ncbi:MAG: PHM/PNGase F domain-containing protein [Monoraphidium minutum]|nr:MAG: PHM/PNGase F domain-containing protein [Monoraphidium minutum]
MLRLSSKQKAAARKIAASLKKGPAAAATLSEAAPPPLSEIAANLRSELAAGHNMGPKCMAAACSSGAAASSLDFDGAATAAAVSEGGKTPEQMSYPVTKDADGSYTATFKCGAAIPAVETTYMTCYLEVPTDQVYHITQFTTLYGHRFVHHSAIYACTKGYAEPLVDALFKAGTTGPFNQKDHNQICEAFYMVGPQSVLEPTYAFPKVAGLPIGKDWYRYLAIEVHYNNPGLVAGEADPGTGLIVKFEKRKRKNDIGLLTVGQIVLDIPPGQEASTTNRSVCHRDCTKRFPKEATVVGQMVHMHGMGKAVTTQWLRGNEKTQRTAEIEPMVTVKGFDYDFMTWLDAPDQWKTIKPGDELSMSCTFDSTGRNRSTTWGFGTQDEMCFWWIYHYPAMTDQAFCSSIGREPINFCLGEVSPLYDLKKAADAANDTEIWSILFKMLQKDGRAIVSSANKPTPGLEWDPKTGCSSQLPQQQ